MTKTKLILSDKDLTWLKKFSSSLNSELDFVVMGTASNKLDTLKLVKAIEPDFILMDISLDIDLDGIKIIQEIHQIGKAKIIIVSAMNQEKIIEAALSAGAVNYIQKKCFQNIPDIIRQINSGTSPTEIMVKKYMQLLKEYTLKSLTPAEKEVFVLLEQGTSISRIAQILRKTEGTVKIQINSIYKKLDVPSREDALKKFLNTNMVLH